MGMGRNGNRTSQPSRELAVERCEEEEDGDGDADDPESPVLRWKSVSPRRLHLFDPVAQSRS
jgi:hypothetical protein